MIMKNKEFNRVKKDTSASETPLIMYKQVK